MSLAREASVLMELKGVRSEGLLFFLLYIILFSVRVAETPEELRKSGERRSGRRCREERRVSEGRYVDSERSDDGGVKGLS